LVGGGTMLNRSDVTACLVTRGDQPEMLERIRESLIFPNVIVWDNSVRPDRKTAGRYYATMEARTPVVYYQDDDVVVPQSTQEKLLAAYEPGVATAVYGHGATPGGYDDLPLVGAGALIDRALPWQMLDRYLQQHPCDDAFLYDADFIAGVLYPVFKQVRLPFEINMAVAQHPSRLCNQPWQANMKLMVTERARAIRDRQRVAA
jgi:hypothetical protein